MKKVILSFLVAVGSGIIIRSFCTDVTVGEVMIITLITYYGILNLLNNKEL